MAGFQSAVNQTIGIATAVKELGNIPKNKDVPIQPVASQSNSNVQLNKKLVNYGFTNQKVKYITSAYSNPNPIESTNIQPSDFSNMQKEAMNKDAERRREFFTRKKATRKNIK